MPPLPSPLCTPMLKTHNLGERIINFFPVNSVLSKYVYPNQMVSNNLLWQTYVILAGQPVFLFNMFYV